MNVKNSDRPLLIIISGPSGSGKSTLCSKLVADQEAVEYSISCTTRKPRGSEKNGVNYFFLTKKEFNLRVKQEEFLEYARVHGNDYGTLEESVFSAMEHGHHIVLDIDVQGAKKIRERVKHMDKKHLIAKGFVDIFIHPPSMRELESRLLKRGTDSKKDIMNRLKVAEKEVIESKNYTYQIVNDNIDIAYLSLVSIIDDLV